MGSILEYVKMAVQSILSNKGRSFLTMLGIIIGIASVIMIMAVGEGTTGAMTDTMDNIAGGQIYIGLNGDGITEGIWITEDDVNAVRDTVNGVQGVEAGNGTSGETTTGKGDFSVAVNGNTQDGLMLNNIVMKYGSYLNESDIQNSSRVCVISSEDAKRLFGSDDVLGMDVDVVANGVSISYRIKGITSPKDESSLISYSYYDSPVSLTIPYSAISDYYSEYNEFSYIYVQADRAMDSTVISAEIVDLLEKRHECVGEEYFQLQTAQDQLSMINDMLGVVTAFISVVAGISLLVGGIGVMNIMLVSVTERTREIGIRKSLGAKTASITMQFLFESAIITVMGGIIGIIIGLLGATGICSLMSASMDMAVSPGIKASTVLIATLFSAAVGIFFGLYPARKAAKLSPIEALRRN